MNKTTIFKKVNLWTSASINRELRVTKTFHSVSTIRASKCGSLSFSENYKFPSKKQLAELATPRVDEPWIVTRTFHNVSTAEETARHQFPKRRKTRTLEMRRNGEIRNGRDGRETDGKMMVHWAVVSCGCRWHEKRKGKKTCWLERAPDPFSSEVFEERRRPMTARNNIENQNPDLWNRFTLGKQFYNLEGARREKDRTCVCVYIYVYIRGKGRELAKGKGRKEKKRKKKWRDSTRACLNGAPYLRCRPVAGLQRGERKKGGEAREGGEQKGEEKR